MAGNIQNRWVVLLKGAGGYREHDILVINENGAEDITKFPFGPEHNIIK